MTTYRTVGVTARNTAMRKDHGSMEVAVSHIEYMQGAMFPTEESGVYTTVQVAKIYETKEGSEPVEVFAWKKHGRN